MNALINLGCILLAAAAILGGPIVAWWDRRPPDYPAIHLKVPFVGWPIDLHAPDSLAAKDAKRLKAVEADLGACHASVAVQNASLKQLHDKSVAATSAAQAASDRADQAVQSAEARAAHVLAAKATGDLCAGAFDILKGKAG